MSCVTILIKAIPAVFHNLKPKNMRLGFTIIIRSERFTVVYIEDLTNVTV